MPTLLSGTAGAASRSGHPELAGLGAVEAQLGRELLVRVRHELVGRTLETWCWNELVRTDVAGLDLEGAARRLAERLRRAADTGALRDALDVLDYMERHRRFTRAGWTQDVLRFAYRQSRREALARLTLTGRRGILFLDDETEELCILLALGERVALLSESKLCLEDFHTRAEESFELALLGEDGEVVGAEVALVPVCPPLGRLEDALLELFARGVPVLVGRNPESGLPFLACRGKDDELDVYEYVVHSEHVDPERIEGFPPVAVRRAADGPAWRDVLMCPSCGADLPWHEDELACGCGATYPVAMGRPDFLAGGAPPAALPADLWAPNPKQKTLLYFLKKYPGGIVLDSGSGNSAFRAPNLVNLEVFPFASVSVVADGQRLPFRDASLDAVVSAAVLEHVPNPFAYCTELWRVLKPGGEVRIDSAFLQPYHACPDHYFGTTKPGLMAAAARFQAVGVGVASGQSPFVALQTWLHAYETLLPTQELRDRLRSMTVADILSVQNGMAPAGLAVPTRSAHRIAAGVYLHGVKQ